VPFDFCYTWLKAVVVRSILFSHLHPNSTIQFQRRETSLPLWRALRSRVSCRVVGRRLYPCLCLCLCLPLSLSPIDIHGFRFSRCFGRSLSLRTSSHQPLNLPLHRFFSTLLTGILQLSQHPQTQPLRSREHHALRCTCSRRRFVQPSSLVVGYDISRLRRSLHSHRREIAICSRP
jgi:hypothetical protein